MAKLRRKKKKSPERGSTNDVLGRLVPQAATGKSRARRLGWRWKLRLFVYLPLALAFVCTAAAGLLFAHYSSSFPDPLSLRHKERAPIIRILASDGSVLAERGSAHDYMPLDLLPRHVIDAVVATEDRRFFEHNGLDPYGLIRAMFANIRAGRYAQGGSTLTQQLAKNLFLTPERTMSRKLEELALAVWLELRLGKQDILELYLNRVYFGAGAYGIEAAAQRYFDKSARNLSLSEAAVVAGLLKAPSKFSPLTSPGPARTRARVVLKKMLATGFIDLKTEAEASREIVRFAAAHRSNEPTGLEYAIDYVLERMPPLVGSGHAEMIVETTIDAKLQRRAQAAIEQAIQREGEAARASQAGVVMLDMEGGISALVGGRSYADSQYNRAIKSRRQPGSTFKPFVYAAALEAGFTPDSMVYDLPVTVGGYSPRNDSGIYRGAVTMRQALAQSMNSVAVRLQHDIGVNRVAAMAKRLGIHSELRKDASLALGTSEVSLLEMTGAYTVFANGGRRVEPHIIKRVRISSGRTLYARSPAPQAATIAPVHVGAINDMLNAAMVKGTGKLAGLMLHPAAGKTGTTQDFRDAWFIGYTAHLACGVWVGNDQGRTMNNVRGGSLPAVIWRDLMTTAHEQRAIVALPGTAAQDMAAAYPSEAVPASNVATSAQRPYAASIATSRNTPTAALPLMPRTQIDADFIQRALEAEDGATSGAPEFLPWSQARSPSRREPPGLMALGRRAGDHSPPP